MARRPMTLRPALWMVVLATAMLAGCAAQPLATAARTRGFNVEEFFTKEPRDVRVALRTDDRARRGPADPALVARVTVGAGDPRCYALALVPIAASAPQELAPEKPPVDRRWHVFGLSNEGIDTFERARREVRPARAEGGNLNVTVALNDVIVYADDPRGSPLRIDFALDRRDGWFTMLAETTIRPSGQSAGRPAAPCAA